MRRHGDPASSAPSVAVVITAYTTERWSQIEKAVESARTQVLAPAEILLCIDNNPELLERATRRWKGDEKVRVFGNRFREHLEHTGAHEKIHGAARRFGAGSARNAAAEVATSDVLVFMDDDAWAEPDWLARLLDVFGQIPAAVAVGGPPLPEFEASRPAWFPRSFDWIFGCAYEGLPVETSRLRHLFAGNLAVRREAMAAVGGFHSVDFDDLDMCMRLAEKFGTHALWFEPRAIVHHYVPKDRTTWRYFYRRCFFVNRHKVQAFREMGSAADLSAELDFVAGTLRNLATKELMRVVRREPGAIRSMGAAVAGIVLAGLGNLRGRFDPPLREDMARPKL